MILQYIFSFQHGSFPLRGDLQQTAPIHPHYLQGSTMIEAVDSLLATRSEIHAKLQCRLFKAQKAIKLAADNHHSEVTFSTNDWVYIKLHPYCQTSVAPTFSKSSTRFFGPFQIQERIGPVAYQLYWPASSKIHLIFQVSMLKPHHGPPSGSPPEFPPTSTNNNPIVEPLALLEWKWDTIVSPTTNLVLVQWKSLALEDTS